MQRKWLPICILITGLLYIFFIPAKPVLVSILFKIIPMLLIIYYVFLNKRTGSGKYPIILIIGLFFCMLGDGLLIWFVIGLTAFLIGHLFYIGGFLTRWNFSWLRFSTIIPIAIYAFFMGERLVQSLEMIGNTDLMIPVIFYVGVISFMFWSAIMTENKFAIMGSTLFIISDSVLAWNKFIMEIPFSSEMIMVTYYLAQFLIASSILATKQDTAKYTFQ